jgi:hypothetical protein
MTDKEQPIIYTSMEFVDSGVRKKVVIGEENFYLNMFESGAVFCTVPRENDPVMSGTRLIVETLCREITRVQEGED